MSTATDTDRVQTSAAHLPPGSAVSATRRRRSLRLNGMGIALAIAVLATWSTPRVAHAALSRTGSTVTHVYASPGIYTVVVNLPSKKQTADPPAKEDHHYQYGDPPSERHH